MQMHHFTTRLAYLVGAQKALGQDECFFHIRNGEIIADQEPDGAFFKCSAEDAAGDLWAVALEAWKLYPNRVEPINFRNLLEISRASRNGNKVPIAMMEGAIALEAGNQDHPVWDILNNGLAEPIQVWDRGAKESVLIDDNSMKVIIKSADDIQISRRDSRMIGWLLALANHDLDAFNRHFKDGIPCQIHEGDAPAAGDDDVEMRRDERVTERETVHA